jgi:hypothetical protein
MTNEYEVATIIELGKAQDVVLGEKVISSLPDPVTGEPNLFPDPATNDNE